MESLNDETEKSIIKNLYWGYSQKETAARFNLTNSQLRTHIKHIRQHLLEPIKKTTETKQCTRCKQVKPISSFGADKRNTDGCQSICKECDKK